jgi:hypothetical protein
MIVTTIPEANVILNACGCCPMPVGAGPRIECQSAWVEYRRAYASGYNITGEWKTADWFGYNAADEYVTGTSNFRGFDRFTNSCGSLLPGGYDPARSDDDAIQNDFTWVEDSGSNESTVTVFFADIAADAATYITLPATCSDATTSGCVSSILGDGLDYATVTKARFRVGVPVNYSTTPLPKTVYGLTWQYIAAKKTWWNWHDGGRVGTAPAGGVVLVTPDSWQWGGNMSTQFSDWFDIPLEAQAVATETRVANMQYTHYLSTRFGSLPVLTGPQVSTA